jgi:hypothetical protein
MSSLILIKVGGVAAMVGGMLSVVASLFGRFFPQAMQGFPMEALLVGALLLVSMGMVGFHALQRQNYGRIGRAGFWMGVAGPLAVAFGSASYLWWGSVFGSWLLWLALPVGPLVLLVGFVLYGGATLRARVLPRWCGVLFIVTMPAALALSTRGGVAAAFMVFGLAWLALGFVLWARRGGQTEQRARV